MNSRGRHRVCSLRNEMLGIGFTACGLGCVD